MESSLVSNPFIITDAHFNAFHAIDRVLFARLIGVLGRDPNESIHVMGFWLWLEQDYMKDLTIVDRILNVEYPLLNQMVDETVFCITLIENDSFHPDHVGCELRNLQQVLKKPLYLALLHANRITVLRGVSRVISEVCFRAFRDILRRVMENPIRNTVSPFFAEQSNPMSHQVFVGDYVDSTAHRGVGELVDPMGHMGPLMGMREPVVNPPMGSMGMGTNAFVAAPQPSSNRMETFQQRPHQFYAAPTGFNPVPAFQGPGFDVLQTMQMGGGLHMAAPRGFTEEQRGPELNEMFTNNLRLGNNEQEEDVTADNRTVFLTFSKGYPISEFEVRDFLTRKFGNIIEAIHMQEVQGDEQALYARVVVRSQAMVDRVVDQGVDGGRAKYFINGKHVCARKYVRNNQRSPSRSSGAGTSALF